MTTKPETTPQTGRACQRLMTIEELVGLPPKLTLAERAAQLKTGEYIQDIGGRIGEGRDHLVEASSVWSR